MILVINLGLKSIRSIIFDYNGKRISISKEPINSYLNGGFVEQNANEWKKKFFKVIKKSVAKSKQSNNIKYITVTCSSSCLISVDKNFEPLMPVIMVSDKRAEKQANEINSIINSHKNFKDKDIEINAYSQIARILWIKQNLKKKYDKVNKFLSPNDYLITLLLENYTCTDPLNAKKFLFNEAKGSYLNNLFSKLEIDPNLFPDCKEIGSNLGCISKKVATKLELNNCPDIILTTYDAITSIFGGGGISSGTVSDQSGTVSSIRMYSEKKFIDSKKRIFCQQYKPTNGFFIGDSNNLGGGLIEWAKETFYSDSKNVYDLMDIESRISIKDRIEQGPLIFLPNLMGSRSPDWNPYERGLYFGIERFHTRKDFIRSIFESIAFSLKDMIDIIEKGPTKPKKIVGGGGLSQIPIANELKATITGLPFYTTKESEITALGAAIIILTTNNFYKSNVEAAKKMIKKNKKIMPNRKLKTFYNDLYYHYTMIKKSVEPIYVDHKKFSNKIISKKNSSIFNL